MKELFVSQRQTQREQKQHRAQALRKALPGFIPQLGKKQRGRISQSHKVWFNKKQVRIGRIRTEASLRDSRSILGHFRHYSREKSALSVDLEHEPATRWAA